MDFVTAISTGATIEYATQKYACRFIETVALNPHNWLNQVSHHFVGQCFEVVGLNFNVTVEDFSRTYDHPYRNNNLTYLFSAVPFALKGVESFLEQLPTLLAYFGRELIKDKPSHAGRLQRFYELTQPVPCYLKVINAWTFVVRSITSNLRQEDNTIDKFLIEPLARLSFSMLRGLVKLLPGSNDAMLKVICLRLATLGRYGIFFVQTYDFILSPMLDIFEQHFEIFCEKSALLFVYCAFSCEMSDKSSFVQLYKFLGKMLNMFAEGQQSDANGNLYLRLFTNELITDRFLAIQFATLEPYNSNAVLMATLQYLETLQCHLASTEAFPIRFVEQILLVVLNGSATKAVCSVAAQLYITLSNRQYNKQEIVVHIIETFLKTQHNSRRCASYDQGITLLRNYLKVLMEHFAALQRFGYYINVMYSNNVRHELVLFTAHSIYAVFEFYTSQYNSNALARQEVQMLLSHWPRLLKRNAQRSVARAVLLGIYCIVDFRTLAEDNIELLKSLETFCLDMFLTDESLNGAEFGSLFTNICKSIEATGSTELLVMAAQTLQDQCAAISVQLICMEGDEGQSESENLLQSYAQCVRRLCALLKENKLRGHQVCDMYDILARQLLNSGKRNECLDLYGYECLALMLALLYSEQDEVEHFELHKDKVLQIAKQLRDVCVKNLRKDFMNFSQNKPWICCILLLQVGLHYCLPLDAAIYDLLINKISDQTLAQEARGNMLFCVQIQEIHFLFRQLHSICPIPLPSNRIWKSLLQFQMIVKIPDLISPELGELIPILIKRHFVSYARCLPIINLHICNESTSRKRVNLALDAHFQLVEQHASVKEAWLLRLYVFNASLEMLVKNLSARRSANKVVRQRNQLVTLQHLISLVSTLRLENSHFMNIGRLLYSLKSIAVGDQNKEELDKFLIQISAHKYRCEDAEADTASELRPLPVGPLTKWEAEVFSPTVIHS
ncbi:uncharacterized protein LOC133842023 [Drosophila sulfurigaster albostrigata]|uniref:uncharacterized protein LOC133842023 n=1 Tax=Drosophila sulfurigaster albostrigata TaxID=89887 RepID=UPI002D21E46E|nr:uncharacterized protein LOC133842023 [Drosophila sulfurigaster albostrigata]